MSGGTIHSWLEVPDVALATSDASYAIVGHQSWKTAYIAVIELDEQTWGLLICEVRECKLAPNPRRCQVALVIDENVSVKADQSTLTVTAAVTQAPSLVSLVTLPTTSPLKIKLRFEVLMDYLTCVKALNDAAIALDIRRDTLEMKLRRGMQNIPTHSPPDEPETICWLHGRLDSPAPVERRDGEEEQLPDQDQEAGDVVEDSESDDDGRH